MATRREDFKRKKNMIFALSRTATEAHTETRSLTRKYIVTPLAPVTRTTTTMTAAAATMTTTTAAAAVDNTYYHIRSIQYQNI